MSEIKIKLYGDDTTLHTSIDADGLRNNGRNEVFYYAEVGLHFEKQHIKYKVRIPLTKEQYDH